MKAEIYRKINRGFQLTLPQAFREKNRIRVGSLVSVTTNGDSLIVKSMQDSKSLALAKLDELFAQKPSPEFANLSDQEIMDIAIKEIDEYRKEKNESHY